MKQLFGLCSLMVLGAGLGELALSPKTAQASELCNYRNEIVRVSGAYINNDDTWVTKGWWLVEPGECMVYPDNWYTYVEVDRAQTVERTYLLELEGEDIQAVELCVLQDRFTFYNGDSSEVCNKHHYGFTENSMQTFYLIGARRELIEYTQ